MTAVQKGEENFSLEEKIGEIGKKYKIPIILGIVGAIFILSSVLLLSKRSTKSNVTFTEQSSSSASIKKQVVIVDIAGSIEKPGVYQLSEGSRIGDLIVMAGGLDSSADREWIAKNVNQAARLLDGTKVYIPSVSEPISEGEDRANDILGMSSDGVININIATMAQLENLPGIGPVTAKKIVDNRPYQNTDELKGKKVVGKATFEKIKDLISVY